EAAVRLERAEIERQIRHCGGQDPARSAAREVGLEAVAWQHAAAIFVDQLLRRDTSRRELYAGLSHAARDREAAQPFAPAPPVRCEPCGAFLDDIGHPVERLDVLFEGRPAEQADLCHIGWTMARQPALSLDRFDHRRLFAADIG